MSQGVFMVVNFALIVAVVWVAESIGKLNGVIAAGSVVYFWTSQTLFLIWRMNYASLDSMSDRQLDAVLSDWIGRLYRYQSTHLDIIRRNDNRVKTERALMRVIAIHEALIRRAGNADYENERANRLQRQLDNLRIELKSYSPPKAEH